MEKKGSIRYCAKWSKQYLIKYKFRFFLLLLLMIAAVVLNLYQVNFVQRSIDAVLDHNIKVLLTTLSLFIAITILRITQNYLFNYYSRDVILNMNRDLKNKCMDRLVDAKASNFSQETKGDLYTRIESDTTNALGFVEEIYGGLLLQPLLAVGGLVYLFYYNWKLTIFTFITLPLLAILINMTSQRSGKLYSDVQESQSRFTEVAVDIIDGYETIKAYNMQQSRLAIVKELLAKLLKKENDFYKNDAITLALILSVTYIPTIISFIFGGYLVSQGEIKVSVLFAYSQLIPTICLPTISLFGSISKVRNSYYAMKRINKLLEFESEREDGTDFKDSMNSLININHVGFSYDDTHKVLNDLCMKFEKGKCVGVMGSNGIGKSTLIQLLCGLYEADSGSISMFGHNINAWKLDKLRQHISYMCQEIVILPDTIYENIRYGNMKATEEEIYNAARMAGLEDFIKGLEAGYNTVLQEDGANLSGGQKQRISMARTFLKNSDLYIFDEPTASLEPELEKKIMNEIMKFIRVKNAASLIVSHNVNNLSECDTIYYMQNGKVIESGSMNELLLKKGKFYQKYNEMIGVNSL